MSAITTHILDTSLGKPAQGVKVKLFLEDKEIGSGTTNSDGRVSDLLSKDHNLQPGSYKIEFNVGEYFNSNSTESFYSNVPVCFEIKASEPHYHVPLLLNPYGYSTYRGS